MLIKRYPWQDLGWKVEGHEWRRKGCKYSVTRAHTHTRDGRVEEAIHFFFTFLTNWARERARVHFFIALHCQGWGRQEALWGWKGCCEYTHPHPCFFFLPCWQTTIINSSRSLVKKTNIPWNYTHFHYHTYTTHNSRTHFHVSLLQTNRPPYMQTHYHTHPLSECSQHSFFNFDFSFILSIYGSIASNKLLGCWKSLWTTLINQYRSAMSRKSWAVLLSAGYCCSHSFHNWYASSRHASKLTRSIMVGCTISLPGNTPHVTAFWSSVFSTLVERSPFFTKMKKAVSQTASIIIIRLWAGSTTPTLRLVA